LNLGLTEEFYKILIGSKNEPKCEQKKLILNMKKLIFILLFFGCDSSSHNSKYVDETSITDQIQYYNLSERKVRDDNGTIIEVKVPRDIEVIEGWDNTLIQYEWFTNNNRNIISIDKLETSNTTPYLNNDKQYNDDMSEVWLNSWKKNLNEIKNILPPFYKDVQMISFQTDIKINSKYFVRRQLYCKDSRLVNTKHENKQLIEVQYITLFNKRKYTITYRYYGGDKGIGDLISMIYTIGGTIKFI